VHRGAHDTQRVHRVMSSFQSREGARVHVRKRWYVPSRASCALHPRHRRIPTTEPTALKVQDESAGFST
jgi:hypothetical protein